MATLEEHLTLKLYVDQAISHILNESSLLRLNQDEKMKLNEQDSIFLILLQPYPKRLKNYLPKNLLIIN